MASSGVVWAAPASQQHPAGVQVHCFGRPVPWPAVVVARCLGLASVLAILAAVHVRHRPGTICPLRAVTGVPCPFCGGTTAAPQLGRFDIAGALRASPLAVGLLAGWPVRERIPVGAWLRPRSVRWMALVAVLAFAEIWQLVRCHVV